MGVVLLVYNNTAASRGCHTNFDYQIRGHKNIAKVPLEIYEPHTTKYGDLIIHLFMCFLINQILRNNYFNEI